MNLGVLGFRGLIRGRGFSSWKAAGSVRLSRWGRRIEEEEKGEEEEEERGREPAARLTRSVASWISRSAAVGLRSAPLAESVNARARVSE